MSETNKELKLVKLNYTQRIAESSNHTGKKISQMLQQLVDENQKHETIVDDFLDFTNQIINKLNHKEQLKLNEIITKVTDLKTSANKGIECMLQLLNDQNKLTKESTLELQKLLRQGI